MNRVNKTSMQRADQEFLLTTEPKRVQLYTLIRIRWIAVAGQAVTILIVHFGLGFELPLGLGLAVVAASGVFNLALEKERRARAHIGELLAAYHLSFDVVQLAVLFYLMGGLENPFALLILAPVTVSASVLTLRYTVALCILSLACITVLAANHLPLPWAGDGLTLPKTYILGACTALALGIVFFTFYTWRVAREAREISNALFATQLALAREKKLCALDNLAAAAAHELGGPLGTIAVATRKIARSLGDDSAIAEDVDLLTRETERCRSILAELVSQPEGHDGAVFNQIPLEVLVEAAASRHTNGPVQIHLDAGPASGNKSDNLGPLTRPDMEAEIVHGIGNLIQNAVQFAVSDVNVVTRWSDTDVSVTIGDDGPGFSPKILGRLGEPYLSVRENKAQHMGLGIFIARTLLQRTGATIAFANRRHGGGAEAIVRWDRKHFQPYDEKSYLVSAPGDLDARELPIA